MNKGAICVGVEFDQIRIENGKKWLSEEIEKGKLSFVVKDIYDTTVESLGGKFDIIILKDVIEHIHDQSKLLSKIKRISYSSMALFFLVSRPGKCLLEVISNL